MKYITGGLISLLTLIPLEIVNELTGGFIPDFMVGWVCCAMFYTFIYRKCN